MSAVEALKEILIMDPLVETLDDARRIAQKAIKKAEFMVGVEIPESDKDGFCYPSCIFLRDNYQRMPGGILEKWPNICRKDWMIDNKPGPGCPQYKGGKG